MKNLFIQSFLALVFLSSGSAQANRKISFQQVSTCGITATSGSAGYMMGDLDIGNISSTQSLTVSVTGGIYDLFTSANKLLLTAGNFWNPVNCQTDCTVLGGNWVKLNPGARQLFRTSASLGGPNAITVQFAATIQIQGDEGTALASGFFVCAGVGGERHGNIVINGARPF